MNIPSAKRKYVCVASFVALLSLASPLHAQNAPDAPESKSSAATKKNTEAKERAERIAEGQEKLARADQALKNAVARAFAKSAIISHGLPSPEAYMAALALEPADPAVAAQVSTVTGRVFAITKSGDLKPARLARVYLIPESTLMTAIFRRYMTDWSDQIHKPLSALSTAEIMCRSELETVDKAIPDTLKWDETWATYPLGRQRIIEADADEEGNFKGDRLTPGDYEIAVRGRVGANDAYWQETITVGPSAVVSVKLATPSTVCPDEEELNQ